MIKRRTGISSFSHRDGNGANTPQMIKGRVRFTILDDVTNPEIFKTYGEWESIGSILFCPAAGYDVSLDACVLAKPLFPNFKAYPLINEIVYILEFPSYTQGTGEINNNTLYYFQPINLFNSNHHNALPNGLGLDDDLPNTNASYAETELGLNYEPTNKPAEINLGNTFIEKDNIRPIQAFEGDIIHEGRWGQSLRFGSTVNNSNVFNPWSNLGTNGSPITILRNDQHNSKLDPWIPQVENINLDRSSIYLTSTQQIPIEVASKKYKSYEKGLEPKSPNLYSDSQIILNSGRLLFNSYNDNILLSSNDSINLNAQETVNVDAEEGFSVSVGKQGEVLLGSNDFGVVEPVILGDKFLADIENLANILVDLGNNFELNPMLTTDELANASLLNIGGELKQSAQNVLNNIENYKSKVTFSK